jgi:hypothetical protein
MINPCVVLVFSAVDEVEVTCQELRARSQGSEVMHFIQEILFLLVSGWTVDRCYQPLSAICGLAHTCDTPSVTVVATIFYNTSTL